MDKASQFLIWAFVAIFALSALYGYKKYFIDQDVVIDSSDELESI